MDMGDEVGRRKQKDRVGQGVVGSWGCERRLEAYSVGRQTF